MMLESVAASYADRSVGVILTGTGRDGAMGIKAIKEAGGTTIVQDEATSEHFGTPRASIDTGMVDFILPVPDIPKVIIRLIKGAENMMQKYETDKDEPA